MRVDGINGRLIIAEDRRLRLLDLLVRRAQARDLADQRRAGTPSAARVSWLRRYGPAEKGRLQIVLRRIVRQPFGGLHGRFRHAQPRRHFPIVRHAVLADGVQRPG